MTPFDEPRLSAVFAQRLQAGPADIDELGHVSNVVYLRWVQEIAKAHSRAAGWDHAAYVRLGAVFVVRRHTVDYLASALAGDELDLTTWIATWSGASSERRTRVVRRRDGRELARAATLWALVDVTTGRPRRVPPEVQGAFAASPPTLGDPERA